MPTTNFMWFNFDGNDVYGLACVYLMHPSKYFNDQSD